MALIPHYDNAEGGTHDTRFCYLGEERLALLERELPDGAFVLGVDEHTALCLDLDDRAGRGGGPRRGHGPGRRAARHRLESGETVPLGRLAELAAELAAAPGRPGRCRRRSAGVRRRCRHARAPTARPHRRSTGRPLLGAIRAPRGGVSRRAGRPRRRRHGDGGAGLDDELWAWSADTLQSDALDRGRASLRAMVAELGSSAAVGARDPAGVGGALRGARPRHYETRPAGTAASTTPTPCATGWWRSGSRSTTPPAGSSWHLLDGDGRGRARPR